MKFHLSKIFINVGISGVLDITTCYQLIPPTLSMLSLWSVLLSLEWLVQLSTLIFIASTRRHLWPLFHLEIVLTNELLSPEKPLYYACQSRSLSLSLSLPPSLLLHLSRCLNYPPECPSSWLYCFAYRGLLPSVFSSRPPYWEQWQDWPVLASNETAPPTQRSENNQVYDYST